MKSAIFMEPGKPLVINEAPEPIPATGEVLVEVGRCGICATDLHSTEGRGRTLPPGSRLGHEFAGKVVAVGADVVRFKVGDHLAALSVSGCGHCVACLAGTPNWCSQFAPQRGGLAQFAVVKDHAAVQLPKTISMSDGALVEPLAVGLHGAAMAHLEPGAKVLVIGVGAVGLGAVYWARQLGAGKVVALARSEKAAGLVHCMGGTALVSRGEEAERKVRELLGGVPDVVFECVGMRSLIDEAVRYVRPRGTVIVLGYCVIPDTFTPGPALFKEVRMQFSFLYSTREFETVAERLEAAALEPSAMVSTTIGLNALPEVFERLREPNSYCKVHVDPWAD